MAPNRDSKAMRKGKGRFFNRPTISKGKKYDKFFMYIPTEVARDTNFPLKDGDRIEVEIKGKTLIKEEALLLAKFLRNEKKEWKPRLPTL